MLHLSDVGVDLPSIVGGGVRRPCVRDLLTMVLSDDLREIVPA